VPNNAPTEVGVAYSRAVVQVGVSSRNRRRVRAEERIVRGFLFLCALLGVLTTFAIVFILFTESLGFFEQVSVWEFLTGTVWTPTFANKSFGVLPLVTGTLLTSLIALALAGPVGLLTADVPQRVRLAARAPRRSSRRWRCWRAFRPSCTATSRSPS
jgi:ABC-type phosphate transport system permease subunit